MGENTGVGFDDIPGTYVFDGHRSRQGIALNLMATALNDEAGRRAFREDPEAFMEEHQLTDEQKDAVRRRDWARMIELGGNVYFVAKIGLSEGRTVPEIVASMGGQSVEEYAEMMRQGGRRPHG